MPDNVLTRDGPVSVPLDYTVPQSGELIPLMVRATLDGTSAASGFYAVVEIIAPSGRVMGIARSSAIAAGGSADVTWFPGGDVDTAGNTDTFVAETFFLDTRATSVSSSQVLASGTSYLVTAQGTWSAWGLALNTGVPESDAMFPTSGRGVLSTQVGLDPDTLFAYPSSHPNTIGNQQTFQMNLGSGWAYHTPVGGPYTTPQGGHAYTYQVTGQGSVISFRIDDSPLSDNYGAVRITVQGGTSGSSPGSISSVTSSDGSLTVTHPTGPNVDLTGAGGGGAVSSVFGRTGAVVATSGDYTAALVTNAADKSSGSTQTFTGALASPDYAPSGLTGATGATRYVGGTASGAPGSGTFAKGDYVVTQDGHIFVCTVAGSPGTWVDIATVTGLVTSVFGRTGAIAAASNDYTLNQIGNATADYSLNSHKLTSVTDPTSAQDAATKNYVDTNVGGQPLTTVTKGSDQSSSSTTLAADNALIFTPASGSVYLIRLVVLYSSVTPVNIKVTTGEDGTTRGVMEILTINNSSAATIAAFLDNNTVTSIVAQALTTVRVCTITGYHTGNAGTFSLWFATNSAGTVTVKAGSTLTYQKVT